MMPSERRLSTTFHILFAASLLACGTQSDRTATDTTAQKAFRVALLTPGPISDQSWNGGAYQGLLRVRDSLGASISHIQT
jgi:basic membrane lipoprotein Med (substrate-binding protein (PBP1-ABC) superfamily)